MGRAQQFHVGCSLPAHSQLTHSHPAHSQLTLNSFQAHLLTLGSHDSGPVNVLTRTSLSAHVHSHPPPEETPAIQGGGDMDSPSGCRGQVWWAAQGKA